VASWKQFLEGDSRSWEALRARIRQPVLLELRRHLTGLRRTEQLADEFCDRLGENAEERLIAVNESLRACVAAELNRFLEGEAVSAEFDRDWASALLMRALLELRKTRPQTQRLLLRLYDRPEGGAPLTAADLAAKLELPLEAVERALADGRAQLRALFEAEVERTLADPDLLDEELELLLPAELR